MPKLKTTIEIEIEVEFDYQKAEQATRDYPGCSEMISIGEVCADMSSLDEDIFHERFDEIEDLIWANRDSWEEN